MRWSWKHRALCTLVSYCPVCTVGVFTAEDTLKPADLEGCKGRADRQIYRAARVVQSRAVPIHCSL